MLVCVFFAFWHTRPRVQRAPGFPCALFFQRVAIDTQLGRSAPRDRDSVPPLSQRHCEERSDEAIHSSLLVARWIASLALAMTDETYRRTHRPHPEKPALAGVSKDGSKDGSVHVAILRDAAIAAPQDEDRACSRCSGSQSPVISHDPLACNDAVRPSENCTANLRRRPPELTPPCPRRSRETPASPRPLFP